MKVYPDPHRSVSAKSKEERMDRCGRHEVVLEAVGQLRNELRDHVAANPEFSRKTFEILHRLVTLYACLEIEDLKRILTEFRAMDQRKRQTLPRYKDAA